jgi:HlyD family secretion protein
MKFLPAILFFALLIGCTTSEDRADAYGNFEAREIIVSAETAGKLVAFSIEEGQSIPAGAPVGLVDTVQLQLQINQLQASLGTLRQKTRNAEPEVNVLKRKRDNLQREIKRVGALVEAEAATRQQLDELEGQLEVVDQQIVAARANTRQLNTGILAEADPIYRQIDLIQERIRRSKIVNPIQGTVLTTFAEQGEFTGIGKPLYKVADLEEMYLRAYVSGEQLSQIKIGQPVEVRIDGANPSETFNGTISWVAQQAEFTPKIVQTKEERVNLVYAIKVKVANDGRLKIGMPGEVYFHSTNTAQHDAGHSDQ